MIKKWLFTGILFIGSICYGQKTTEQFKVTEQLLDHSIDITSIDLRDKSLVGSIYVNESFLPAKLSNDNTIYAANYNAYQDEMVIDKDGKQFVVAKNFDNEISFVGVDKVYKAFNFDDGEKETKGFFVVLNKGDKLSLLSKESIKYYEAVEPSTGYDKYKPPTLKRENDKLFFGFSKNHVAIEIPKNKKDIFRLFKDSEKEVEQFAKNQKLNPKKEDDLIRLVVFYNTL